MRTLRYSSSGMRRSDIWLGAVIQEAPVRWPSALQRALPGWAVLAITSPPGLGRPERCPSAGSALTSRRMRNYGPPRGGARDAIGASEGSWAGAGLQNAGIREVPTSAATGRSWRPRRALGPLPGPEKDGG